MTSNEFITEHFEVGQLGGGNVGPFPALVCRRCGAFVWDTEKHHAICILGGDS